MIRPWSPVVEIDVDGLHALGHVHVESIDIKRVANPLQLAASRGEADARRVLDVVTRAVATGNPLRVQQDEIARLRDRDRLMNAKDRAGHVGGVNGQLHRAGDGDVARRRYRVRLVGWNRLAVRRRHQLSERGCGDGRKQTECKRGFAHSKNSLKADVGGTATGVARICKSTTRRVSPFDDGSRHFVELHCVVSTR